MKSGLLRGQLIKWKDNQGFGFIQPVDRSQDVFLHISEIKDSTRRPQVGDTIYYYASVEDGKTRACNAFILGARKKPTSRSTSSPNPSALNTPNKFPILEVFLLSILPLTGSVQFALITTNFIPIVLYPAMSLLTFTLYSDDKNRAKRRAWRISERTLHLAELAGGWLGGFAAQRTLRHKTIKSSYQTVFWAIVILHLAGWLAFWIDWQLLGGTLLKALLGSSFRK